MWIYQQSSGRLFKDVPESPSAFTPGCSGELPRAQLIYIGAYSGHGEGVNNPALQHVHDVGPIPQGDWLLEVIKGEDGQPCDYEHKKAPVIRLTPEPGTETFGRAGFLIHGDLVDAPGAREASHGCIILPHPVRKRIGKSGDYLLKVIP